MVLGEIETWIARPFGRADEEFHVVVTEALARWTREHDAGASRAHDRRRIRTMRPRSHSGRVRADAGRRSGSSTRLRSTGQARLDEAGIEGPLPVVILADGRALAGGRPFEVAGCPWHADDGRRERMSTSP